ncbi:hypothetical protein AB4Z54_31015, partial [Streptomyces sp. MCAF7]
MTLTPLPIANSWSLMLLSRMAIKVRFWAGVAKKAREQLIKGCEVEGSLLDHLIDAVLVADANAKPWAELIVRIERHGVREGLAKQRQKVTEALVNYGIALSTSMVTNAGRLH